MIRPIVQRGDPMLHQRCLEVDDIDAVQEVVTDLHDTLVAVRGLYRFTRGSGIAAPQIGLPLRVDVLEFGGEWHTLINPVLRVRSPEKIVVPEGCLSFFQFRGNVLRYADVAVEAVDGHGDPVVLESGGNPDYASLLQHEMGHLDGLLYTSSMSAGEELRFHPEKPDFGTLTTEPRPGLHPR